MQVLRAGDRGPRGEIERREKSRNEAGKFRLSSVPQLGPVHELGGPGGEQVFYHAYCLRCSGKRICFFPFFFFFSLFFFGFPSSRSCSGGPKSCLTSRILGRTCLSAPCGPSSLFRSFLSSLARHMYIISWGLCAGCGKQVPYNKPDHPLVFTTTTKRVYHDRCVPHERIPITQPRLTQ